MSVFKKLPPKRKHSDEKIEVQKKPKVDDGIEPEIEPDFAEDIYAEMKSTRHRRDREAEEARKKKEADEIYRILAQTPGAPH